MPSSSTDELLDWLGLSMLDANGQTYVDHEVRKLMEEVGKVSFTDEQFRDIVESISSFVAWRAMPTPTRSGEEFKFFSSELGRTISGARELKSLITVDSNPRRAGLIESINFHGMDHNRLHQLRGLLDELIEAAKSLSEDLDDSLTSSKGRPAKMSGNLTFFIAEIKQTWLDAGGHLPGPVGGRHIGDGMYTGTLFDLISTVLRGHSEVLDGPISDLAQSGILMVLQMLRDAE